MQDFLQYALKRIDEATHFAERKNTILITASTAFIFPLIKLHTVKDLAFPLLLSISIALLFITICICLSSFFPKIDNKHTKLKNISEEDDLMFFGAPL